MSQRPQVRPATEGWKQKLDEKTGKPLLQFAEVKGGKPPVHLVDLTPEERAEKMKELGVPAFRAKQIAAHYYAHYTSDPADMTDLPAAGRDRGVVRAAGGGGHRGRRCDRPCRRRRIG